jgi:hypothetical protein
MDEQVTGYDRILGQTTGFLAERGDDQAGDKVVPAAGSRAAGTRFAVVVKCLAGSDQLPNGWNVPLGNIGRAEVADSIQDTVVAVAAAMARPPDATAMPAAASAMPATAVSIAASDVLLAPRRLPS